MINDRIAQIEATLDSAEHLPESTRAELRRLLAELKSEVAPLADTHGEHAERITHFTDATFQSATRAERQPEDDDSALKGLRDSVAGLETSHPQLTQIVNRIALTLSNMGI